MDENTAIPENPVNTENKHDIPVDPAGKQIDEAIKLVIESKEPEPIKRGRGRPRKDEQLIREQAEREKQALEIGMMVDVVITTANQAFTKNGYSEMNPLQIFMIRTGLIGYIQKYNIDYTQYPEYQLMIGLGWVAVDKYSEHEKKRKAENEKKQSEKGEKKHE